MQLLQWGLEYDLYRSMNLMDSKVTTIAPIVAEATQTISSANEYTSGVSSGGVLSQPQSNQTINRPKLTISKKALMKVASSNTISGSQRDDIRSEQMSTNSGLRVVKSVASLRIPHTSDGDNNSFTHASSSSSGIAGVKRDIREMAAGGAAVAAPAGGSTSGNIPKKQRKFKLGSSASTTNLL